MLGWESRNPEATTKEKNLNESNPIYELHYHDPDEDALPTACEGLEGVSYLSLGDARDASVEWWERQALETQGRKRVVVVERTQGFRPCASYNGYVWTDAPPG